MTDEKKPRWWDYDQLPSGEPYDWGSAARNDDPDDAIDFHLDLGCGRLKKGRLGIDRYDDPGVDIIMDLERLHVDGVTCDALDHELYPNPAGELIPVDGRLPFPTGTIQSIISHHALEHIGPGFIRLMDECHRVLVPGGVFRIIVPLFPSHSAAADPDHKRNFLIDTFKVFEGEADGSSWMDSFSTPYTLSRFIGTNRDYTPRNPDPAVWWTPDDAREMRLTLTKHGSRDAA
jgi:SAM-dependent methyltransferase